MTFVVDNSVALSWCFESEQTEPVMALLARVTQDGAVAPQLWPIEATNGLLMAERRGRISASVREGLAGFLQALPIRIDNETASRVWVATAQLAAQHRLTAYDAAYLELALRLGLPLATYDRELMVAAPALGVQLLTA